MRPGVNFRAEQFGAKTAKYFHNGQWLEGPFNPEFSAYDDGKGGGPADGTTQPMNGVNFSKRYGGALIGEQLQGRQGERLFGVADALKKAFDDGAIGNKNRFDGIPTWEEVYDYVACWEEGKGPFANYEPKKLKNDGSVPARAFRVDDPTKEYGDTWQLDDGRYVMNIHGTAQNEKREIDLPNQHELDNPKVVSNSDNLTSHPLSRVSDRVDEIFEMIRQFISENVITAEINDMDSESVNKLVDALQRSTLVSTFLIHLIVCKRILYAVADTLNIKVRY